MFPPMPPNAAGWHPLLIHFPVALLVIVPLFILLGILFINRRQWVAAALILLVLGTAGVFASVYTGEKTGDWAGKEGLIPAEATDILQQHQKLGHQCRTVFLVLALVYAALVAVPVFWRRNWSPWLIRGAHILFLLVYLWFLLWIPRTAHLGGRLVHEFGVQAPVAGAATTTDSPAAPAP